MASKELIEKVAREMQSATDTGLPWHLERSDEQDFYRKLSKAAISTILTALQRPTPAMKYAAALYTNGSHDLAHAAINAAVYASPLGEQSE
ncbi:hypothetical protein [Brucella pseudogrignonensis]|uniref:Uncharacterized protein n=1 Tax=Brucella pseudogrignonensis TaxID=419475 RepID=A0ABU1M7F8_9HYPH|nr:hypothetical protein [Brucella pseudogrignonensis]MDR6431978.1 hypothetical protein [Brucella pseudogrignonensis]